MSLSRTRYEAPPPIIYETVYTLKDVEQEKAVNLDAGALFGKSIFTALGNLTAEDCKRLPPAMNDVYNQWNREGNCYRKQFALPPSVGGTWEIAIDTNQESMTIKVSPAATETTSALRATAYEKHCIEVIPDTVENEVFNLQALGSAVAMEQFAQEKYGYNLQKTEWVEASISQQTSYIEANYQLNLETL